GAGAGPPSPPPLHAVRTNAVVTRSRDRDRMGDGHTGPPPGSRDPTDSPVLGVVAIPTGGGRSSPSCAQAIGTDDPQGRSFTLDPCRWTCAGRPSAPAATGCSCSRTTAGPWS